MDSLLRRDAWRAGAKFLRQPTSAWSLILWVVLPVTLVGCAVISLGMGRYPIPVERVIGIVGAQLVPVTPFWTDTDARVVLLIRVPRILVALIAGAGLGLSGASLQGVFRNPLVGPQIIGVSSSAGFGGALAILLFGNPLLTVSLAFVFGLLGMVVVYWISRVDGRSPVLTLVLAGVVTNAFFAALISLVKFVADPYDKLPAIVFWLMGSFAAVTDAKLFLVAPIVGLASAGLYLLRWRINVLSLGDEEAQALGIRVERVRWSILICVTAISAAIVSVSGIIGWVGLVVPHIARMLVGPDHRVLLPASAMLGGVYLLLVDDLARTLTAAEIPLGIITAILGAPVFGYLLKRLHTRGWAVD
jgi:iron complex transport system permease protein